MASVLTSTLFLMILLFIITNSIHGYCLYQQIDKQDPSIINDDLPSDNKINHRSVLWPKIYFTTLIRKNEHQQYQDQQHEYNKHRSTRNI